MLAAYIELILWITGLATAGVIVFFLAPAAATKIVFGQPPADALGLFLARNWALLVFLVGALLVYSAYHAEVRVPALSVAVAEKVPFALGLLISPFRGRPPVLVMALADVGMAVVYLVYLLS
jgi:hypothetical protein